MVQRAFCGKELPSRSLGIAQTLVRRHHTVDNPRGPAAAVAWMRFKFRFQRSFQVLAFTPLLFPQLMLGAVMLLWFSVLGNFFDFSMALWSAVLGHVVYITPFALIIIAVANPWV